MPRIHWVRPKEIRLRALKNLLNNGNEFSGDWDQVASYLQKNPTRYEGFKIHFPIDDFPYSTRQDTMLFGGIFDPVEQRVGLFGGDSNVARRAGLIHRTRSRRYSPKTIRAIAKLIDDRYSPRTVTLSPHLTMPEFPRMAEKYFITPLDVTSAKGIRAGVRAMEAQGRRAGIDWDSVGIAREKAETFDFRSPRIRRWLAKDINPYKLIIEG